MEKKEQDVLIFAHVQNIWDRATETTVSDIYSRHPETLPLYASRSEMLEL